MKLPAYAILMAGGYGTRFWPASRRTRPKQFLALAGKDSLLQQTYRRLARLFPPSRIYVVGNAEHARLLRQQLPRVPPGRLLLEPVGRNTAAAIALAAEHIRQSMRGDAVLGVFPADHAIGDERRFARVTRAALAAAAAENAMVVLGIPPTHAHTGYGYIERGAARSKLGPRWVFLARRFTEKPDARTAARYLRTRRYYWNSGMFFWRLSMFSLLLREHLPGTDAAMQELGASIGRRSYSARLGPLYRHLDNISVDYALAEPAAARGLGRMLVADIGWSDLGSWAAVFEWRAKGRDQNLLPLAHFVLDARGSLVETRKFVAAIGVDKLIIVETPDALLVCTRERAQEVGKVVHYLEKEKLKRLL